MAVQYNTNKSLLSSVRPSVGPPPTPPSLESCGEITFYSKCFTYRYEMLKYL